MGAITIEGTMTMIIDRRSPLTGKWHSMDLPTVTQEQMDRFEHRRANGELIQNIFPDLSDEQREFILTGYTPDDWRKMFPPETDDE
jgi:hypothetical protein